MYIRTLFFSILILICSGAALGQRPGPEFWGKVGCEPYEPRTTLEDLEERHSSVLVKGFTRINTVEIRGVRVDAVEIRDIGRLARSNGPAFAKGVIVVLREDADRRQNDLRALVDYDELDPLINAIDALSRVDESVTKLAGFEARYKTRGDLEISVFRQTRSGTAVLVRTGLCDRAIQSLTLDDLAKFRAVIQEAKARLDEIK